MAINIDTVPEPLKKLYQFVLWKFEPNPNDPGHPKKVPINPKTGAYASTNDPDTWASLDRTVKQFNKGGVDGIGFVFTDNDPFAGIDLDDCRNAETGKITRIAQRTIRRFDSYTEISPSGTGVHIFVMGKLAGNGLKFCGQEIYDRGRYFTITGNHLAGAPLTINKRQKKFDKFYNELSTSRRPKTDVIKTPEVVSKGHSEFFAKIALGGGSGKFWKLMSGDYSNYPSPSEADMALCSILSSVTDSRDTIDEIFRTSGLMREKWDESHGDQTYGEQTIDKVLNNPNPSYGKTASKDTPQLEIAHAVIGQFGRQNIFYQSKQFWVWKLDTGAWTEEENHSLMKHVHKCAHLGNLTQSHVTSILGLITTELYECETRFKKVSKRIINCANGELHFIKGEWVLKPFNRDNYFIQQIPVAHDETAVCKRFMKFLNRIFAPDSDKAEKIMLLQEFMGYALTASCEFERLLMLIGNGSNGKSVFLGVLTALLGTENVSAIEPSQFDDRFAPSDFQGKLANIITEIPEGAVLADAKIKTITSGERMTVQRKFGHAFVIEPYATLFFAANHLPHTKDSSHAFFRRAEILTFNVKFEGEKCDRGLKAKLIKELPGILLFALNGLKRLYANNDFTQPQCSLKVKRDWAKASDQAVYFVDDECELGALYKIIIADLYPAYANWATNCGFKSVLNQPNFVKRLESLGCESRPGTKGAWTLYGIRLKSRG